MLAIDKLTVGEMDTNCYLVSSWDGDPKGSSSQVETECLIIDPGDDADFITETIIAKKLVPKAILLTHGHFDHVLGCLELKLNFNLPIYLNEKDKKLYSSANQSATHWLKKKTLKVPPIDQFIKEGDEIKVGAEKLTVIETPGHTPGSICLYHEVSPGTVAHRDSSQVKPKGILFTGDTLFADSVGRTDFSYSKPLQLTKSLDKIFKLPGETIAYPGHGDLFLLKNFVGQAHDLQTR